MICMLGMRIGNIPDLVCQTNPDLITITPVQGMSDHSIVISEIDIIVKLEQKQPRLKL